MNPVAQDVVDILGGIFLTGGDVGHGGFRDAPAIEAPAFVAIANFDDVALRQILGAVFIGRNGDVENFYGAMRFAAVVELAEVGLNRDVFYVEVGGPAQAGNGLLQNFVSRGGTLVGSKNVVPRRRPAGGLERDYRDENRDEDPSSHN